MSRKFPIALAVLFLSIFAEFALGDVSGVWLGFVPAALTTLAFFLNLEEMVFMVLFAAFVLNWQPAWSPEILVFSAVPIVVYFIRKLTPLQPFIASLFFIFASVLSSYAIFSPHFFADRPGLLALDLLASLAIGTMAFWTLNFSKNQK